MKEAEEQRHKNDLDQIKANMEKEHLEKVNNVRQELLKAHRGDIEQLQEEHLREVERLKSLSGMTACKSLILLSIFTLALLVFLFGTFVFLSVLNHCVLSLFAHRNIALVI